MFQTAKRVLCASAAALTLLTIAPFAEAQTRRGNTVPAPIVFFDITGSDVGKLRQFYSSVFGWEIGGGPFAEVAPAIRDVPVQRPLSGTLRREEAGQDPQFAKVIYLGVPDVTATLAKIEAEGGKIHQPRFAVPGVVILGLFKDPAGNVMGLVEMDGDKAKVP